MVLLIMLHDIGSSLMFYGGLLAVLYVATNRPSFVLFGLVAFALGAWYIGTHIAHVDARVVDWLHPFVQANYDAPGGSFQLANAQFTMAAGGLFGQGFGQALLTTPIGHAAFLPAAQTDMIFAVIVSELGLYGGGGLLICYLLLVWRGFKTATLARDSFSKLMATGLSAIVALQVFVIVGGVTRVIPLTGRDPAVRLLRRLLDPRELRAGGAAAAGLGSRATPGASVNRSISRLFVVVLLLFAVLILFTSRWTVLSRGSLQANSLNKLDYYASLKIKRGEILTAGGAVLAKSVSVKGGTWTRRYPFGPLFAQAVGYAVPSQKQLAGIESYRDGELAGTVNDGLSSVFGTLHTTTAGDDVTTNLDQKAQTQARSLLDAKGTRRLGRGDRAEDRCREGPVLEPQLQQQRLRERL